MSNISEAAVTARENAREHGKFGEQGRTDQGDGALADVDRLGFPVEEPQWRAQPGEPAYSQMTVPDWQAHQVMAAIFQHEVTNRELTDDLATVAYELREEGFVTAWETPGVSPTDDQHLTWTVTRAGRRWYFARIELDERLAETDRRFLYWKIGLPRLTLGA